MKITKHIKLILLMVVCMLILAGCKNGKDGDSSQTTTEKAGENTEAVSGDAEDVSGDDAQADIKYLYSDAIQNRSTVEGKMAVYFLRGDYAPVDDDGNTAATGEATLLIAPDGTTMIIDCNNCMINGAYVAETLQKLGIEKLDYFVLTSPHIEHLGGYSIVMRTVEIGQIITNNHDFTSNGTYNNFIKAATGKNIPITRVAEGDTFTFGQDVQVQVLNPAKDYEDWKKDAAQRAGALLLKLTYNQSSFLIGGDISAEVEAELIAKYGETLKADVTKMNAMASKDSNSKEWITAVSAKIAVGECSVVDSDIIIGRYAIRAEVSLHTAIDGTCLVYTTGDGTYEVQVERERVGDTYLNIGAEKGYLTVQ